MATSNRTVLVAGATGLVGREILQRLLADDSVVAVHALGRRAPALQHAKLHGQVVDFSALPALPPCDEVYLALGTTIKVAGSQAAFRAVDFDANVNVARAALAGGAKRLGLVSAMGADARSSIFYNRVKGETEDTIAAMGYQGFVAARPSFLVGDRTLLGQPVRSGEGLALRISTLLRPLIPANYRSVNASAVAQALLASVPAASGKRVLFSGAMHSFTG
ncbi:NAD(P)H-binding protein [Ramlibacter sp.]|uniref:NAD(P)H-binding protein n=1 Tax=Ramlibacter sp. TaxID=1917967 RepID=UPI0017AD923A|nr:NAD(P)H-binding protein [Ramlibacter sp.]MBA2674598.1 NAD(P)H-binding protein [Ramlibacter sp.]